MTQRDDLLRRVMAANPLPGELDLPDDVAGSRPPLDLLTNEGRVALTGSLHKDPATAPRAKKRPWWAKPATVFATACLLVFGAIGIVVVSNGGQPDFVEGSSGKVVGQPLDQGAGLPQRCYEGKAVERFVEEEGDRFRLL